MGDGYDKPGKTASADSIVTGTFNAQNVPGKRTLTGDYASPTGDRYIDRGPACGVMGSYTEGVASSTTCFLTDGQRARLIDQYQKRVDKAEEYYQGALIQLGVEQLIDKEEEIPWFVTLLLDVAGARALNGLLEGLGVLKAATMADLARLVDLDSDGARMSTKVASSLYVAMHNIPTETLGHLSKKELEKGRDKAIGAFKKHLKDDVGTKAKTIGYINQLKDMAAIAFAELREQPPGQASDAQLLVLWRGFAPEFHLPSMYTSALAEKIKRFQKSGVKDIGTEGLGYIQGTAMARDTKLVRVKFRSGYPAKYALSANQRPDYPETPVVDLSQAAIAAGFQRWVDDEFATVALERQEQQWGQPPEEITVDDSNWEFDPARAKKARENSKRGPLPFGIPRLQLGDIPARPQQDPPSVAIPGELKLKENDS